MDKINEIFNMFRHQKMVELEKNLKILGIKRDICTIREDYSVDLKEGVAIKCDLSECPVKFNTVNGNFVWMPGNLASLINMPLDVLGNFIIAYNKIESLQFCPTRYVRWRFDVSGNKLKDLTGCPATVGGIVAINCGLTSLHGSPKNIHGDFLVRMNNISSLVGGPSLVVGNYDVSDNKLKRVDIKTDTINKLITKGNPIEKEKEPNDADNPPLSVSPFSKTLKIQGSGGPEFNPGDRAIFKYEGEFDSLKCMKDKVCTIINYATAKKTYLVCFDEPVECALGPEYQHKERFGIPEGHNVLVDPAYLRKLDFSTKIPESEPEKKSFEKQDRVIFRKTGSKFDEMKGIVSDKSIGESGVEYVVSFPIVDNPTLQKVGRLIKVNPRNLFPDTEKGKDDTNEDKYVGDAFKAKSVLTDDKGYCCLRGDYIQILKKKDKYYHCKNMKDNRLFIIDDYNLHSFLDLTDVQKADKSPYENQLLFGRDGPEFKTRDRVKTIENYIGIGAKNDKDMSDKKGIVVNYTANGLYLVCFDDNLKGTTEEFNMPKGHGLFIFAKNLIKINNFGEEVEVKRDSSPHENIIKYGTGGPFYEIKDRVVYIGKDIYNNFYGEKAIVVDYNYDTDQYLLCFDKDIKRYAGHGILPYGHGYWALPKDIVNLEKFVPDVKNEENLEDPPHIKSIIFGIDGPEFKKGERVIDKTLYRLNKKGVIVTYNNSNKLYLVCFDENVSGMSHNVTNNIPTGHGLYVAGHMLNRVGDKKDIIDIGIPDSPFMDTISFSKMEFATTYKPKDRVLLYDKSAMETISELPEKDRYGVVVAYFTTEAKHLICFDKKLSRNDVVDWEFKLKTVLQRPTIQRRDDYNIPDGHGLMVSPYYLKLLKSPTKEKEKEKEEKIDKYPFNKGDKVMYISTTSPDKTYDKCRGEVVYHNMYDYDKNNPDRYNTFDVNFTNKSGNIIRINWIRPENLRLLGEKFKKEDKVIFIKEDDPLYGVACSITKVKDKKYDIAYYAENETKYREDVDQVNLVRFIKNIDDEVNINDEITYTKPDSKHCGCKGTVISYDIGTDKYKIEIKSKDNRIVKINTKDENLERLLTIKKIKKGDKIRYINNHSAYNGWPGEVEEFDNSNKYVLKLHSKSGMGKEIHITTEPDNVVLLDETMDLPELKFGQIVIYNNPSSKYDKLTGEFQGYRTHDQKQVVILDNENKTKLSVDPGTLSAHYGERTTPVKKEPVTTTTTTTGKKKKKEKEKPLPPVLVYNRRPVVRRAYKKKEKTKEEIDKDANVQ